MNKGKQFFFVWMKYFFGGISSPKEKYFFGIYGNNNRKKFRRKNRECRKKW